MQRSYIFKKKDENGDLKKKVSLAEDIQKFDDAINDDINKIRNQIDELSKTFLEVQKRYIKAEKEYLEAKVDFFTKAEEKDKLVFTLRQMIENNESEKAKKLSQLLSKFEIKSKIISETQNVNENK